MNKIDAILSSIATAFLMVSLFLMFFGDKTLSNICWGMYFVCSGYRYIKLKEDNIYDWSVMLSGAGFTLLSLSGYLTLSEPATEIIDFLSLFCSILMLLSLLSSLPEHIPG